VPFFLLAILAASTVLATASPFYSVVLAAQLGCYFASLFAWILEQSGVRSPVLALPQYFVLANVASMLGLYKFLRGERYALWQPLREPEVKPAIPVAAGNMNASSAPAVSVIVPAYNCAPFIGEALASV